MATALHSTRTRFFDKCGKPLCGGTVHTYQAGTTTAKPTYTDVNKTAVNTNPVILDSIGSAAIFLDGAYRVRVLDRNGVLVEDIAYIESWISATEKDALYTSIEDVSGSLSSHVAKNDNPHGVTKAHLGLGNVDNTADINKPLSDVAINALSGKSDKTDTYTKNETDNRIAALSNTTYAGHKGYPTLAAAQAAQPTLAANTLVEVTNDTTTANNGVYLWDGSALTKSAYDVLTSAKAYVDLKLVSFTERSGYIAGVLTSDNKILMAFRISDGLPVFANGQSPLDTIEALNTSLQSKFEVSASSRSGVLYGLKTLDGSLPFYIDIFSGAPIFCGVDILAAIRNIESNMQNIEPNIQLFPDDALVGWGDSLTGAGSSGDWLQKLANQIGRSYYNGGIGGQDSKQIASRSGAVPARFTQEFVIPATTTPITVSVNEWTPCSRGGDAQLIKVKGITGQLSRSNEDVHTFVRSESGSEVTVGTGSYAYSVNGDLYSKRFLIIGTGRNSISTMQPHEIVSTVKAMIDGQKTQIKRAIVWSIPYFPNDSATQKQRIDDINTALKNAFPEYFVDIAGWLCSSSPVLFGTTTINDPFTVLGITPTSQDLTDISNKLTPISLRTSETDGHFNQNCGTVIAYRMKRELEIKGWI